MITRRAFDDWLEPRRNDMSLPNPAKRAIVAWSRVGRMPADATFRWWSRDAGAVARSRRQERGWGHI